MKLFLRQWQVAYRVKPCGSILSDNSTPFISIPNTQRYSAADPFLFSNNEKTYLFAEIFDKKDNRGKLGYSVFENGRFSEWKIVISEKWHLSYPNIFEYNSNVYIVPEANESKMLYAYKAVSFPDRWERCAPILSGTKLVDTTFADVDGKHMMFTYDIADQSEKKLYVYEIEEDGRSHLLCDGPVSTDDGSARPGGNFFYHEGNLIRVSQDCTDDYGTGVVFSKVLQCDRNAYKEEQIKHLSFNDIKLDKKNISGFHTYNANDSLEVIDFHVKDYGIMTQVYRVLSKIGYYLNK